MRKLGSCFLACATLGLFGGTVRQTPNSPSAKPIISLSLSAVQDPVKSGSPVRVKVTLKNESSHDAAVATEVGGLDFRIEVRDAKGGLPPETSLGYVWNGHVSNLDPNRVSPQDLRGAAVYGTMKAGSKFVRELDVSKRYDLKQPGKYTVTVEHQDPENPSLIVKSNTITMTVTP